MRTPRPARLAGLVTVAALLVNCADHQGLTDPGGGAMSAAGVVPARAVEAAHHPGFPRLYFLPPLVSPTSFEGDFDPTLVDHLSVEICRANGASCLGDPVVILGGGPGAAGIRLDADEEHYIVNWQVRGDGIAAGDYRLHVRLGAVVIGGVALRLGNKLQDLRELPPEVIGIQLGRSIPVKFRIEQATDAIVSVRIDPATATTVIGSTSQFTATVIGADGTPRPGEPLTWSSSDESVATVDADGLATGIALGSVTITATTAGGLAASATLDVRAPDLRVGTLTAPSSVRLGGSLALEAVITNAGNSEASAAQFRFRVLDAANNEEVAVATLEQPVLSAGATAAVSTSFTPEAGWPRSIIIEAVTDAGATISESDESNNSATSDAIAFVAPDLTVAIAPPGASVLAGSTLTVEVSATNAGTSSAGASSLLVRVLDAADGTELFSVRHALAEIAAGEATAVSLPIPVVFEWPSPIIIEASADADGALVEWDETNNSARTSSILVTRPDLHVTGVAAPASVPAGEALAVTAAVKNLGSGIAAATDIRFRVVDAATSAEVAVTTVAQAALDAGGTLEAAASFTTTAQWPREVRVEVTTDASAAVRESDETNNTATSPAVAITLPDLKVTTIDVPATLPAGAAFTAIATIANAGAAAAPATQTRLRVLDASSGAEVATSTQPTASVAAGATATASASFTSTRDWPRQLVVEATVDAGATVAESDETNNVARSAVLGLTDPDLVVTSVTFSATTVGLRCSLGIQAVVRNIGNGGAPAANLRFSLRSDAGAVIAFIVVAQPALAAGAEATVSGAFTAGSDWPGLVAGHAEADVANAVPEADEANNLGIAGALVEPRVVVPAGYQKMWVCGSNTSWTDGGNWEPAGAPATTHNVFIPAGVTHYPVLAAAQTVNDLLIESGAQMSVAAHALTATGNVASGLMLGTGDLNMTGTAKTLRGVVPNMDVHGSIALSGDATASRVIVNAGRSLNMNGFTQNVTTDVTVVATSSGVHHLALPTASSRLVVGRNLTVGAATNLAAGVIHVRGDLVQNGATNALAPGGTTFIFDGTGPQAVHFSHLRSSYLRDAEIRGPSVNFTNHLSIAGQLHVAAGGALTQTGGNAYYSARVPTEATAGSYRVPTSVIDGMVTMVSDVALQAPNASIVVEPGHQLNLAGFALTVGGNVSVTASSVAADHILMGSGDPRLEVRGDMVVGGRTKLDVGSIVLRGDFVQNGATNAMIPTGTKMILDGPAKHAVHFSHLRSSWLGDASPIT
jgi:subtilase family serine protease